MRMHSGEKQSLGFGAAFKVIGIIALPTVVALGFLMQVTNVKQLNAQLIEREQRLAALQDEVRIKRAYLARIRGPEWLRRRIAELGIELQEVQPGQIVRAYGGSVDRAARVAQAASQGVPR